MCFLPKVTRINYILIQLQSEIEESHLFHLERAYRGSILAALEEK